MKKSAGAALILVFAATAVLVKSPWFHKRNGEAARYCPAFQSKLSKISGQVSSHEPLQIVYAFPLDYGDGKDIDFVVTELSSNLWKDKQSVHPRLRYIKNLGHGKFSEDDSFPVFKTEHARHLIPIELKAGRGFVFADHGVDAPPFSGAIPRIILKQKDGTWKEFSEILPRQNLSFNFNVAKINTDKNGPDIFVSVVADTEKKLGSYLLKNDGHDHFTFSDKIPEDLRKGDVCFMSSHTADLNENGQNEIVIGACDRAPDVKMAPRDRILRVVNGALEYAPEDSLPQREKDPSWGTVSMTSGDINHDGHIDIVAAIHNFGFTEGAIQIYMNTGKDLKFRSTTQKILEPVEPGKNSFIPWVRLGDLDGDGLSEILAPITPVFKDGKDPKLTQNFALYKNVDGEHFVDVASCLNSTLPYVSAAELMDLDRDGKTDVLLLGPDGRFEIFYNHF